VRDIRPQEIRWVIIDNKYRRGGSGGKCHCEGQGPLPSIGESKTCKMRTKQKEKKAEGNQMWRCDNGEERSQRENPGTLANGSTRAKAKVKLERRPAEPKIRKTSLERRLDSSVGFKN